jgi:hypothetical protein
MELGQMLNSNGDIEGKTRNTSWDEFRKGVRESEKPKPSPTEKGCPKDIKECADGTIVARNALNDCKFDECPDVRINEVKMEKGLLGLDYKTVLLGLAVLGVGYLILKKK